MVPETTTCVRVEILLVKMSGVSFNSYRVDELFSETCVVKLLLEKY